MGEIMHKAFGSIIAAIMVLMAGIAHAAPPLPPATISVEPTAIEPDLRSSIPTFVEALGNLLSDKGFTLIEEAGHARIAAEMRLSRVSVGTTTAKVTTTRPELVPGGSPSKVGGSLNLSLPSGKSRTVPLQQTRLEIRLKMRGDETVMWHGVAITVRPADTPEGQDSAVAAALGKAIFRDYPAQSDTVISVP